ncbi:MAG: flagella basal body P-ring formation protein FlgA [Terracidiphilus sp.]|jgi:hypothetical protein
MKRFNFIFAVCLLAAGSVPALAQSGRVLITADQVATAISASAMVVSPDQVTLLTEVVSKTRAPGLTVESIEPWGSHRIKVRLGCAEQDECLPFFVAVHFDPENGAKAAGSRSDQTSGGNARTSQESQAYVVRAGSRAILLIDSGHVHVRLNVVCLENGAAGQSIRVECKDPRQTYIAKVVNSGVLRGSL